MYKNQLQELAQRSCFNLPSYTCIREGPDHAPRFKATVNFNGEIFESPNYFNTLRQAEHAAAEVALNSISTRGPSHSLAARVLDETGVYKNLLQEISQRVGAPLPRYTTYRSGLGHHPVFTGVVELAGITFTGEPAKNKKQAEKNAAMAAWSCLKQLAKETASSSCEPVSSDELEQITIARALINYRQKEKIAVGSSSGPIPFTKQFLIQNPRPSSPQSPTATRSKILPLICQRTPRHRPMSPRTRNDKPAPLAQPSRMENCGSDSLPILQPLAVEKCVAHLLKSAQASCAESWVTRPNASTQPSAFENLVSRPPRFPAAGAAPYVTMQPYGRPCHGVAPPVTVRTAVPVFSAPPLPPPRRLPPQVMQAPPVRIAPPVCIRQAVPSDFVPPIWKEYPSIIAKSDPLTNQRENPSINVKGDPLTDQNNDPPASMEEDPKKIDPVTNQQDGPLTAQTEDAVNIKKEDPLAAVVPLLLLPSRKQGTESTITRIVNEAETAQNLEQLKL